MEHCVTVHEKRRAVYAAKNSWKKFNDLYSEFIKAFSSNNSGRSDCIQIESTPIGLILLVMGERVRVSKRLISVDERLAYMEVNFHHIFNKSDELILKLYIDEWDIVFLDIVNHNRLCDLACSDLEDIITNELIYSLLGGKALKA